MKLTTTTIALLAGMAICLFDSSALAGEKGVMLSEPEQEVISAALTQCLDKKPEVLVLDNSASLRIMSLAKKTYDQFAESLRDEAKTKSPDFKEALEDMIQKNRIETRFILSSNAFRAVKLFTKRDDEELFSAWPGMPRRGWDAFYERYPKSSGLIFISRPGMSKDGRTAIMYLGVQSHGLTGLHHLWIFSKVDGKWILQPDRFGPWIIS